MGLLVCLLQMACATNTLTTRDNYRVLPLAFEAPSSVTYSQNKPVLLFDDGSMTGEEQLALINKLHQWQGEKYSSTSEALHIQLNSCRIIVHVGKVETQYNALCHAQLAFNDVPLALSSARAQRQTRTRGISERQMKEQRNKNPWMELKHTQDVIMAAAEGALTHLLNPSGNKSNGFYFNPETIERALKENDQTLLRAIMAKQAHRNNIEDDELLIGLMAHPDTRLAQEAGRTLFLRCQTRNKKLFQTMNPQSESDDAWPVKALSCIEAVERNLMPLREKALVQELD